MFRVLTCFLLVYAGPLLACDCGGSFNYAPIVASPVVVSEAKVVDTQSETVTTEQEPQTQTEEQPARTMVERPAIPKSIYPDEMQPEEKREVYQGRLKLFDLPIPLVGETVAKPDISEADVADSTERADEAETQTVDKPVVPFGGSGDSKKEEEFPPESVDPELDGENGTVTEKNVIERGQASSRSGKSELESKPDPPEGVAAASIPQLLKEPVAEVEKNRPEQQSETPVGGMREQNQRPEREKPTEPKESEFGGGSMVSEPKPASQWTITVLVMLAAVSVGGFVCMVFVVEDYRRRWLNAIMSQNGAASGIHGGPYDYGYGRYDG